MAGLIDLSVANSGEIGKGQWFSDLYRAAVASQFTGGILINAGGDRAIFFEAGKPVHAGGAGYTRNFLGELLVRKGLVAQSDVSNLVAKQSSLQPRPLLGALLVSEAGVEPREVKLAVRDQTEARLMDLFALSEGTWQSAPGKDARIGEIGVASAPWPLLAKGLTGASDAELRDASDRTLGKAVKLGIDQSRLDRFELDPLAKKLLKYMEKARKPDQLERALRNRKLVRAVFRILLLEDGLSLLPIAKAIPIPKATLLKGVSFDASALAAASAPSPPKVEKAPEPPKPRAPSKKELPPIAKEVKEFHAGMKGRSYFELLDVPVGDVDAPTLRKNYTALAKKFHPDAFPSDLPEEVTTMAREVSAQINEAYQTLADDKRRAQYLALLSDDRIKGDARKAELIRDAETKAQMGVVMLRKREYQKAREFFKFAMEADSSSAPYKTQFVWAMFTDPSFDRAKAIKQGYELILEALQSKGVNAQTHYVAGQLLKAQERMREAEHHFKIAVRLDRKHAEAQRELRLLQMRAEKAGDSKKSTFSKLFKR